MSPIRPMSPCPSGVQRSAQLDGATHLDLSSASFAKKTKQKLLLIRSRFLFVHFKELASRSSLFLNLSLVHAHKSTSASRCLPPWPRLLLPHLLHHMTDTQASSKKKQCFTKAPLSRVLRAPNGCCRPRRQTAR